jgi:hypothetical protein
MRIRNYSNQFPVRPSVRERVQRGSLYYKSPANGKEYVLEGCADKPWWWLNQQKKAFAIKGYIKENLRVGYNN